MNLLKALRVLSLGALLVTLGLSTQSVSNNWRHEEFHLLREC